jgi:hypothetical protein
MVAIRSHSERIENVDCSRPSFAVKKWSVVVRFKGIKGLASKRPNKLRVQNHIRSHEPGSIVTRVTRLSNCRSSLYYESLHE